VEFLTRSVRPDGSWPIDTNLATWVTTLSIHALAVAGELPKLDRLRDLRQWLGRQQFKQRHPYTGADPGGWGWTDLPGSVPDADDTSGAVVALVHLSQLRRTGAEEFRDIGHELLRGIHWLSSVHNSDGGYPTFCRGWTKLPFDRSGSDLTAHALRADVAEGEGASLREPSIQVATAFLARAQRPDGSWLPLWFGNQHAPDDENPTYGTARVLAAYRDLGLMDSEP